MHNRSCLRCVWPTLYQMGSRSQVELWRLLRKAAYISALCGWDSGAKCDGPTAGSNLGMGIGCQMVQTYVWIQTAQHVRAILRMVHLALCEARVGVKECRWQFRQIRKKTTLLVIVDRSRRHAAPGDTYIRRVHCPPPVRLLFDVFGRTGVFIVSREHISVHVAKGWNKRNISSLHGVVT